MQNGGNRCRQQSSDCQTPSCSLDKQTSVKNKSNLTAHLKEKNVAYSWLEAVYNAKAEEDEAEA